MRNLSRSILMLYVVIIFFITFIFQLTSSGNIFDDSLSVVVKEMAFTFSLDCRKVTVDLSSIAHKSCKI